MQTNGTLDQGAREVRSDCIVLMGLVLLSALPYLFRLGFYSDDWMYQAWFAQSSGQGFGTMLWNLLMHDESVRVRPVQAMYMVATFKAFGRHPTGYYVVDSLILSTLPLVTYLVLKELRIGRWPAFTIALVFGLLPHYSTDRFWISSQQATLSMIFALLGIYGMLRWRAAPGAASKAWLITSVLAFVLSILSYEVVLGLIAASLGLIGFFPRNDQPESSRRKGWIGVALACSVLLGVGIVKIVLQTRMHLHYRFLSRLGGLSRHAFVEAIRFNFWTYGLRLPAVVISLYRHGAVSWVALAAASVLAVFVAAYLWARLGNCPIPSRRACLWLIAGGFAIFCLGDALFFADPDKNFSSPGLSNRIMIAPALGAACVLVATVGLACSWLRSETARRRAGAAVIAVFCGLYCLVASGLAFFWVEASSQQAVVLERVARNLQSTPKGSVVLLDGFCRYSGPAVVFETSWDTTGALRLTLGDPGLRGDVVSPDLRFGDRVLDPVGKGAEYAYGPHLFVYNLRQNTLTSLSSKQAALAYLNAMNPAQDSGCPPGRNGDGTKVF